MSPHLFLLFVAFTVVSCTETTTTTTPLTSLESSIKSAATTTNTSTLIDTALISQQLINLTRRDWYTNEDFCWFFGCNETTKSSKVNSTTKLKSKRRKGIRETHGTAIRRKYNDREFIHTHYQSASFLISTAPTLWIMGLTEEYTIVRNWVATKFILNETESTDDFFHEAYHMVGGLISLQALTGDAVYLEKAQVILTFIEKSKRARDRVFSTLYLEYHYLSELTGNADYAQWAVERVEKLNKNQFKEDFGYSTAYLLAKAKHAYIDPAPDLIDRLRHQIDTIFANPSGWGLKQVNDTSLWYFAYEHYHESNELSLNDAQRIVVFALTGVAIMKYCNATTTSCLSLDTSDKWAVAHRVRALQDSSLMWQRALELLDTYWILTESKIPIKAVPDSFDFAKGKDYISFFRPEMPEVYFYLWRLTGRQQYRKMAWWMAQAMIKYGWDETSKKIEDIDENGTIGVNELESYYIYPTLRYLYLTFQPNDQYPLDQWITSEWGHFLPVCNGKLKRC